MSLGSLLVDEIVRFAVVVVQAESVELQRSGNGESEERGVRACKTENQRTPIRRTSRAQITAQLARSRLTTQLQRTLPRRAVIEVPWIKGASAKVKLDILKNGSQRKEYTISDNIL